MTTRDEARQQALQRIREVRLERWKVLAVFTSLCVFTGVMTGLCVAWGLEPGRSDWWRLNWALCAALNAYTTCRSAWDGRKTYLSLKQLELGMRFNLRLIDGMVEHQDAEGGA